MAKHKGSSDYGRAFGGQGGNGGRRGLERALRHLFNRAPADDELAAPPKILAKYLVGVMRGLSQLAADGGSRPDLLKVADHTASTCVVRG